MLLLTTAATASADTSTANIHNLYKILTTAIIVNCYTFYYLLLLLLRLQIL